MKHLFLHFLTASCQILNRGAESIFLLRGSRVEGEGSRSRIEVACKQAFPCGFGAKNQRKNKERESETARKMELTASPETALISYAQGRYRIVRPLKYGKETEQLIFKF